ncbi:MAG: serine--tRNA ligase, partial [Bacteroidales bacterium]|nr:serine--tRNA ligase [Bacteroidales bacterium]
CVIINEAERMAAPAQNALLKTLEEAPEYAVFFLLTRSYTSLLPTIRSRCQLLRFPPLSLSETEKALTDAGIDAEIAHKAAPLSFGSIGKALAISHDSAYLSDVDELEALFKRFRSTSDIPFIAPELAKFKKQARRMLEILEESALPQKLTAYTPCFRREAGSYGKDVRGLNRLHQFDKVEIVRIERPEDSYAALDEMVAHVEGIVNKLGLKYRILRLCGGDMSFTSAITYDFELWSAAQGRWLEISSVSNFDSFQANRLHLRYKDEAGKTNLCHTLNGSSLALPRVVAALLEDNQTEKGIVIPEVLRPYTGFDIID